MHKFIAIISLSLSTVCFGQTDILTTDFQTGIPISYTIVDNDGFTPAAQVSEFTSAWITVEDPENSLDTVAASTSFFSPEGIASRWLITPSLNLGAYGNQIKWEAKSHDASFPDDYLVLVSTTDSLIESFTDTVGYVIEEYAEWTLRTINLSTEGYNNQTIFIAFVNVSVDGFILYLDDIRVWKEDPVSVSEMDPIVSVQAFPNPTTGLLTIKSTQEVENISLFNTNGQLLIKTVEKKLNLEEFPNGMYFLKVKTANSINTVKVLKF